MRKHARFLYQPAIPLGKNRTFVTGSKTHLAIAAEAAAEGTVLLKNDGTLPLRDCTRICLFGRGAGSGFLFGGGGSGRLETAGRINLAQGLQKNDIEVFQPLIDFYTAYVDAEAAQMFARLRLLRWFLLEARWSRLRIGSML
jgi:beta-glucosidase